MGHVCLINVAFLLMAMFELSGTHCLVTFFSLAILKSLTTFVTSVHEQSINQFLSMRGGRPIEQTSSVFSSVQAYHVCSILRRFNVSVS